MSTDNPKLTPEEAPGRAMAEEGVVILEGPGDIAATMTAEAAEGTARALLAAAAEARGQSTRTTDPNGDTPRSSNASTDT